MEEKKENAGGLFKVRTYGACLSEGIKLPTRNVMILLKYLWPSLTCLVVFVSLVNWGAGPAFAHLSGPEVAGEMPLSGRMGACLLGALLLLFVPGSLYLAQLVVLIRRYGALGYLPASSAGLHFFDRKGLNVWGRSLLFLLGGWLLWGLAGFLVFRWVDAGWLRLVAGAGVLLLFSLPYAMFGLFFLFDEAASCRMSTVFRQSYKHWGALAAVLLLGGALAGAFAGIGSLPARIMLIVNFLSNEAVAQGDLSDVPDMFSFMQVLSGALSALISALSVWLFVFPLAFLFGSIKQERRENEAYAAEQKRMDQAE